MTTDPQRREAVEAAAKEPKFKTTFPDELEGYAAFIAAANPQVVLALLDEVEALREALSSYAKMPKLTATRSGTFIVDVWDGTKAKEALSRLAAKAEGEK